MDRMGGRALKAPVTEKKYPPGSPTLPQLAKMKRDGQIPKHKNGKKITFQDARKNLSGGVLAPRVHSPPKADPFSKQRKAPETPVVINFDIEAEQSLREGRLGPGSSPPRNNLEELGALGFQDIFSGTHNLGSQVLAKGEVAVSKNPLSRPGSRPTSKEGRPASRPNSKEGRPVSRQRSPSAENRPPSKSDQFRPKSRNKKKGPKPKTQKSNDSGEPKSSVLPEGVLQAIESPEIEELINAGEQVMKRLTTPFSRQVVKNRAVKAAKVKDGGIFENDVPDEVTAEQLKEYLKKYQLELSDDTNVPSSLPVGVPEQFYTERRHQDRQQLIQTVLPLDMMSIVSLTEGGPPGSPARYPDIENLNISELPFSPGLLASRAKYGTTVESRKGSPLGKYYYPGAPADEYAQKPMTGYIPPNTALGKLGRGIETPALDQTRPDTALGAEQRAVSPGPASMMTRVMSPGPSTPGVGDLVFPARPLSIQDLRRDASIVQYVSAPRKAVTSMGVHTLDETGGKNQQTWKLLSHGTTATDNYYASNFRSLANHCRAKMNKAITEHPDKADGAVCNTALEVIGELAEALGPYRDVLYLVRDKLKDVVVSDRYGTNEQGGHCQMTWYGAFHKMTDDRLRWQADFDELQRAHDSMEMKCKYMTDIAARQGESLRLTEAYVEELKLRIDRLEQENFQMVTDVMQTRRENEFQSQLLTRQEILWENTKFDYEATKDELYDLRTNAKIMKQQQLKLLQENKLLKRDRGKNVGISEHQAALDKIQDLSDEVFDLTKYKRQFHEMATKVDKAQKESSKFMETVKKFAKDRERLTKIIAHSTPRPEWEKLLSAHTGSVIVTDDMSSSDILRQVLDDLAGQRRMMTELQRQLVQPFDYKDEETKGSNPKMFAGLGTHVGVPKFLRTADKVKNRNLSKKDVELIVKDVWNSKVSHDERMGYKENIQDFFYMYLQNRFSSHNHIVDWSYNILHGLRKYMHDADLEIFYKVLIGEMDEDYYFDQKQTIQNFMSHLMRWDTSDKSKLQKTDFMEAVKSFFPEKTDVQLKAIRKASDEQFSGKWIPYLNIFTEDKDCNQGALAEALRDQYMEDVQQFMDEIIGVITALAPPTGQGEVRVDSVIEGIKIVDPEKTPEDVDKLLERVFNVKRSELHKYDKVGLTAFIERLQRMVIKRKAKPSFEADVQRSIDQAFRRLERERANEGEHPPKFKLTLKHEEHPAQVENIEIPDVDLEAQVPIRSLEDLEKSKTSSQTEVKKEEKAADAGAAEAPDGTPGS